MKTVEHKVSKECPITIHLTVIEDRYLRARKRETGRAMGDVIREEYLTETAQKYFERKAAATAKSVP